MPQPIQPEASVTDVHSASLRPGRILFSRYRLEHPLGRGAMGCVWLAHDRNLGRPVALKLLADPVYANPAARDALKQETRNAVELAHPNIVRAYDFVEDGERGAIAFEYVDGATLTDLRLEHRLGCLEVGGLGVWVAELCAAVEGAHETGGVIHGDLKPANLLISSAGSLKVTDFGLSCALRRCPCAEHKGADSHAYMSPQQHLGVPPSRCDDVYSIGAILYEALTSRPPIYAGDIALQVHQVIPPGLSMRRQQLGVAGEAIPPVWEETILACLEKDPRNRPATVAEIARRLELERARTAPRTLEQPKIGPDAPTATIPLRSCSRSRSRVADIRESFTGGLSRLSRALVSVVESAKRRLERVREAGSPQLRNLAKAASITIANAWVRLGPQRRLIPGACTVAAMVLVVATYWPGAEPRASDMTQSGPASPRPSVYAITTTPAPALPDGGSNARTGTVIIRTEPAGATVTIDSSDPLLTPATFENVSAGEHVIAVEMLGFDGVSFPTIVRDGQTVAPGTIALRRSTGILQVTTDPPGAQIFLGARELGRTPLTVPLSSGAYKELTARMEGYADVAFEATIPANQTVGLPPIILKPQTAGVSVNSEPQGVPFRIVRNGAEISAGVTPAALAALAPGEYQVFFGKGAQPIVSTHFEVSERGTTKVHRVLPQGTLKVMSSPPGAEVFAGDQSLGVTPLEVRLLEGTHVVSADLNDRTAPPRAVKVSQAEPQSIRFDFTPSTTTPASRARRTKKKPEVTTFTKIGRSIRDLFDGDKRR